MGFIKYIVSAFLLCAATTVSAVPLLQIYIEGATYDDVSETWVTDSSSFTLWVIANTNGPGSKGAINNVRLVATAVDQNMSALEITGTTTDILDDPSIAANPVLLDSGRGEHPLLNDHGIFGEESNWHEYLLGDMGLSDSPIGDATEGNYPEYLASIDKNAQINVYHVEKSPYTTIHFDAYGYYGNNNKYTFVPFSHDGESVAINEPESLAILIFGFVGLGLIKRRKKTIS